MAGFQRHFCFIFAPYSPAMQAGPHCLMEHCLTDFNANDV